MSRSLTVTWDAKKPTTRQVEQILNNFFGDAARVKLECDLENLQRFAVCEIFMVILIGKPAHPMHGVVDDWTPTGEPHSERWLEIWLWADKLQVVTRSQDAYTNACAVGIAQVFADYWKGRLEP